MSPTIQQLFGHTGSNVSEANFEVAFGGLLEGVLGGIDNECRVVQSAVPAMTVEVMTGTFITGGVFARVSAQAPVLAIAAADPINPRIDRVVCRRNNATDTVTVYVLAGTPAANPVPTALTRAGGVWEISLAQIYVGAAVGFIARSRIADERRSRAVCGLISPAGSPDALFPLVNNPGQIGGAEGQDAAVGSQPDGWGLLANITLYGAGGGAGINAYGNYTSRDSGIVVGNDAGWESGLATRRDVEPALRLNFEIETIITDVRAFYGLSSDILSTMVGADAPGPAVAYVGVQYSTPRGDSTWQFVASNGAGQSVFESDVTVTADPVSLLILADEANDQFTLVLMDSNGDVVAGCYFDAASDSVPPAGTELRVVMGLETRTTAARRSQHYQAHLVNRIP